MDDCVDRRLTELERRLAHHERMAEDLSSVLIAQSREIDLLKALLKRLRQRVGELEQGWERSPQDDKPPPHY